MRFLSPSRSKGSGGWLMDCGTSPHGSTTAGDNGNPLFPLPFLLSVGSMKAGDCTRKYVYSNQWKGNICTPFHSA